MGLSNSTASHAEPLEPGKARTGSFEGGNTGGRTLSPAARSLLIERAALRSAPGGTQRGVLIQTLGARGKEKSGTALSLLYGFTSMIPVCGT